MNPSFAAHLLTWYDAERRHLPWRSAPGIRPDPYHVWLSEIMLQQTVVATVIPYFNKFIAKWPRIQTLAAASLDEVLTEWAGLGYYARGRNLHKTAQILAAHHHGVFPSTIAELMQLPGVGSYTAGAIAAIAFDRPEAAIDGNVERVVARLFAVQTPLPQAKPALHRLARTLVPDQRAGDFAQAMMDLGATICAPQRPKCTLCPVTAHCQALAQGLTEVLPMRSPKPVKPQRFGHVYWTENTKGAVLLHRREEKGLLGGMMGFPGSAWLHETPVFGTSAPVPDLEWRLLPGKVRHTFTHFHLELSVACAILKKGRTVENGVWITPDRFGEIALPSLMRKVATHVLKTI